MSWTPLGAARLTLTKRYPLNGGNRVAMHLGVSGAQGGGGILNSGFWGIPVREGGRYELSIYLRQPGCTDVSPCARGAYISSFNALMLAFTYCL